MKRRWVVGGAILLLAVVDAVILVNRANAPAMSDCWASNGMIGPTCPGVQEELATWRGAMV
jgi:hypothetical protein